MNRKLIPAIGAVLAIAAAPSALALGPNVPIQAEVYIGGATAQDPGFLLITRTICQNVSIAVDPNGETAPVTGTNPETRMDAYLGTDNQVYTCRSNNTLAPEVQVGTAIAIYKTSIGGSGTGVIPVARQITDYGGNQVRFLPVPSALPNSGNCTIGQVVGSVAVGARTAAQYLVHNNCGSGNRNIVPQIGISDVEPAFIDGATVADINALASTAVNHGIYGWTVSEPLRNALQAAQGLVPCSAPRNAPARELTANTPNLTRQQIAGLVNGYITNWNQLGVRGTNQGVYDFVVAQGTFGTANNQGCPFPTALPDEGGARAFLMRRVPSSGTQAITEIWTLRQRCIPGVLGMNSDNDPVSDAASSIPSFDPTRPTQAYSSSGGVRNGMDRASGPWAFQTQSGSEYRWAIGLLSCENTYAGSSFRAYRHIRIDGAMPGLVDTANGAYTFYAEQTLNTSLAFPPPTGFPSRYAAYLAANLADPNVLRTVNAGFPQPGTNLTGIGPVPGDWVTVQGQGCLLGVPNGDTVNPPPAPITAATITTTPVNTSLKSPSGSTNNCQDPTTLGELYLTPVGGYNQANPE